MNLLEYFQESFTGIITDKAGRKIKFLNGKRVPMGRPSGDKQKDIDRELDTIDARLKRVESLLKSNPDVLQTLSGATVGQIHKAAGSLGKAAFQGAKKQQQLVSKSLQSGGINKRAADVVGVTAAVLDNTVIPGPLATIASVLFSVGLKLAPLVKKELGAVRDAAAGTAKKGLSLLRRASA